MVVARESLSELPVIGWREWVCLPDLDIGHIKVKVDTGARSSALHAYDVEEFRRGSRRMVRFSVHPVQRSVKEVVKAEARLLDWRHVRDSGGKAEERPVIESMVEMFGQRWPIEITLTRRDSMGFRMLLGRQAIRDRYVVDPGGSYYNGRHKVRKAKSAKKRKSSKR